MQDMSNPIERQPKGITVGGQFAATHHSEPQLKLMTDDEGSQAARPVRRYELTKNDDGTIGYNEGGDRTTLERKEPVSRTEIRRALRCPRSHGRLVDLRHVTSRRFSARDDIYEVVGPESGAPLVVRIQEGFHRLHVQSGNVHIEVLDNIGGSTVVEDGATANVVVDGANKYSVETRGAATASVVLSPQSKVEIRATGTGTMYVRGGGPGCDISAKGDAVVLQDGKELGGLPVTRPSIWW